ncbi:MAG: hypothetical protein AMJ56_09560 [Anaerolineae bacterium SG8_19]|nr:MAG: hypothetical protein AMJ56_09560 [Anaerolineae bacterium SG8_19]
MKVVVLAGGVGGAKLADGVAQILPPENLSIVVNTGDDFKHLGLTICPDLDTVMYNLAGIDNPATGWGRQGESWRTITEVGRIGGPDWFKLGDLDLAVHLTRSHLLAKGCTLTEATRHICDHYGIKTQLLPMSDQPAPTMIACEEGLLPFQNWFVKRQWQPAVQEVPKLVVAVSPIIAGEAVKGPAAKMMGEMGMEVSSVAVAVYYGDLIDVFVFDQRDSSLYKQEGSLKDLVTFQTDTIMRDRQDRRHLAQQILDFSMELFNK